MRIAERKLRKIIRSIVAESSHSNKDQSLSQFIMSNLQWLGKDAEEHPDHPFVEYLGMYSSGGHATEDAFIEAIQNKLDKCASRGGGHGTPSALAHAIVNELSGLHGAIKPEEIKRFLDIIDKAYDGTYY